MDDDSSVDSHGNLRNLIEYEEEDSEYSPSEDTSESAVAKRVRKNNRVAKKGLKEKKVKEVKRSPKEQPKAKKSKKPLAKKKKVESEEEEE